MSLKYFFYSEGSGRATSAPISVQLNHQRERRMNLVVNMPHPLPSIITQSPPVCLSFVRDDARVRQQTHTSLRDRLRHSLIVHLILSAWLFRFKRRNRAKLLQLHLSSHALGHKNEDLRVRDVCA